MSKTDLEAALASLSTAAEACPEAYRAEARIVAALAGQVVAMGLVEAAQGAQALLDRAERLLAASEAIAPSLALPAFSYGKAKGQAS